MMYKKNQAGRSMVEIMGVLAIMGILLLGSLWGIRYAFYVHRENQTLDIISKTVAGSLTGYIESNIGYAAQENGEIVQLAAEQVMSDVPTKDGGWTITTPLEADITVWVPAANAIQIRVDNITYSVCERLLSSNSDYISAWLTGTEITEDVKGVYYTDPSEAKKAFCREYVDSFERTPYNPEPAVNRSANITLCSALDVEQCAVLPGPPPADCMGGLKNGDAYKDCGVCQDGSLTLDEEKQEELEGTCNQCGYETGFEKQAAQDGSNLTEDGKCCIGGVLKEDQTCCPEGKQFLEGPDGKFQCCVPSETDPTKCKRECIPGPDVCQACNDATGVAFYKDNTKTKVVTDGNGGEHCCAAKESWLLGDNGEYQCCEPSEKEPTKCKKGDCDSLNVCQKCEDGEAVYRDAGYTNVVTDESGTDHCCASGEGWAEGEDGEYQCCELSEADPTKCKTGCEETGNSCQKCNDATGEIEYIDAEKTNLIVDTDGQEHCCASDEGWLPNEEGEYVCCKPSQADPTKCKTTCDTKGDLGASCKEDECCTSGHCSFAEGSEEGVCCQSGTELLFRSEIKNGVETEYKQCCEAISKIGDDVPEKSSAECCEGGVIRKPFVKLKATQVANDPGCKTIKYKTEDCYSCDSCHRNCEPAGKCKIPYCAEYNVWTEEIGYHTEYLSKGTDNISRCCKGNGELGSPCSDECPCNGTGMNYYDLNDNLIRTQITKDEYKVDECGRCTVPLLYCRPNPDGNGGICIKNPASTYDSNDREKISYAAIQLTTCSNGIYDFHGIDPKSGAMVCYLCPGQSNFRSGSDANGDFVACCPPSVGLEPTSECSKYHASEGFISDHPGKNLDGLYQDETTGEWFLCPTGHYCRGGVKKPCEPGTYSNVRGVSSCVYCGVGKYCPFEGSKEALPCPKGHYCPNSNTVTPLVCPDGTFNNGTGAAVCNECYAGRYCKNGVMESCPVGSYADVPGLAQCKLAPAGSYVAETGAMAFKACPKGQFTDEEGSTACKKCPAGTYQDKTGQSSCISCSTELGESISPEGSTAESACKACAEDKVAHPSDSSVVCCGASQFVTENQSSALSACCASNIQYTYLYNNKVSCCTSTASGVANISATQQKCCTKDEHVVTNAMLGYQACCGTGVNLAKASGGKAVCCASTDSALAKISATEEACCTKNQHVLTNDLLGLQVCCGTSISLTKAVGGQAVCCAATDSAVAKISEQEQKCCAKGTVVVKNELTGYQECCGANERYCQKKNGAFACVSKDLEIGSTNGCYSPEGFGNNCLQNQYLYNGNCKDCAEGKFCNGMVAETCPAGSYCLKGVKTACPAGTYQNQTGQTSCKAATGSAVAIGTGNTATTKCAAGEQPNANHDGCEPCPTGTSSTAGQAACKAICTVGKVYDNGACRSCKENYYCPNGYEEFACESGTYSAQGSKACTTCKSSEGSAQYWNVSTGRCTNCESGYFCVNGKRSACPEGTSSLEGQTKCTGCNPGTYYTKTGCKDCGKGYYCPGNGQARQDCGVGHYCDETNLSAPKACPDGTYLTVTRATAVGSCTVANCSKGYYCQGGEKIACPAGTYRNATGGKSVNDCTACAEGSSSKPGSTSCTVDAKCPAGYACQDGEQTICPVGTYSKVNETTCTPCPAGKYSEKEGASACTDCTAGYYCPGGTDKKECGAGNYCPAKSSAPTPCKDREYTVSSTEKEPATCPMTKALSNDHKSCITCETGTYVNETGTACENEGCPAGFYCSKGTKNSCTTGHYCPANVTAPINCGKGNYCPRTEMSAPEVCPNNQYSTLDTATKCSECTKSGYATNKSPGGTACTICPGGTFANDGHTACEVCPEGYYCVQGLKKPCTVGHYCPAGSSAMTNCGYGYYCAMGNAGVVTRTACPGGQYTTTELASAVAACKAANCPAGYYCQDGEKVACPAGTYRTETGGKTLSDCTVCTDNQYTAKAGSTKPSVCSSNGKIVNTNHTDCIQCVSGRYAKEDHLSCELCEEGYYCANGVKKDCGKGYYCDNTGMSAPKDCGVGHYCDSANLTAPKACPDGTYATIIRATASTNCTVDNCAKGYYCQNGNMTACPAGTSRNATGGKSVNDCTVCPAGSYSAVAGKATCTKCAAGTYNPNTGATSCTTCGERQKSTAGATACTDCPNNQWANATHTTCGAKNNTYQY